MKIKKSVTVMVLCLVISLMACTATQWFEAIQALLPLVTDTTLAFLQFSSSIKGGALTADQVARIQAFSNNAQTIIGDIGQDVSSVQLATSNEAKIQALIAQLETQASSLIPALGIKDATTLSAVQMFVTTILQDVGDIANLVPIIQGQPASTIKSAARMTGWPESDFTLIGMPGKRTMAVASTTKVRELQKKFAARHNAIRKLRTGNKEVDEALSNVPKAKGPTAVGNIARLQKP